MKFWEDLALPLLSEVDSETVHNLAIESLGVAGSIRPLARIMRKKFFVADPKLARTVAGIRFENPIGLGAGFDKNAKAIMGLEMLGFGFVELGTVTRHAQPGNPRPRMFRFKKDKALINRMGFNNEGVDAVVARLAKLPPRSIPIGISLGKSKITPLEEAPADYRYSFEKAYPYGDYFVVNVSSPNTPGLRSLQDKDALNAILGALNEARKGLVGGAAKGGGQEGGKPIFVKIAPDLTNEAIEEVLDVIAKNNIGGIIATNTTISREGLSVNTAEAGGLSGKPLTLRSRKIVAFIRSRAPKLPIIGVGGISNGEDAREMLTAGADLVQIYTGFVYGGPATVRNINKYILKNL